MNYRELPEVVARNAECWVAVVERVLSRRRLEAYVPLKHLQPHPARHKRSIVSVIDRDGPLRGAVEDRTTCLHIQAFKIDPVVSLGGMDAQQIAARCVARQRQCRFTAKPCRNLFRTDSHVAA